MKKSKGDDAALTRTKAIMAEMLRMPPKPHSEMKLGRSGSQRKPSVSKSILMHGFVERRVVVPKELRQIMRDNSKALEELTRKSPY